MDASSKGVKLKGKKRIRLIDVFRDRQRVHRCKASSWSGRMKYSRRKMAKRNSVPVTVHIGQTI